MNHQILVTGASGHLGQGVIHHLLHTLRVPAARIVATTRDPRALVHLAQQGVNVKSADFEQPASLDEAFAGVSRVLLISTDAIDRPGRRLAQHTAAIEAASRAGVQHVVYTSMPDPFNSKVLIASDHAGTEQALASSGLPGWTVLRNHWYFENLFQSLPSVLAMGGQWFSAAGDGRLANISRNDLAKAAAVALASDSDGTQTLTLSGCEALTTAEQAEAIATVLERTIQVVPVPVGALVQGMKGAGLPEPVAQVLASFDTNTASGHVSEVTGDFQRLTGEVPQRFTDWLQANKGAFQAGT